MSSDSALGPPREFFPPSLLPSQCFKKAKAKTLDLSVIVVNLPYQHIMEAFFSSIPRANIVLLNEIGRPLSILMPVLQKYGWEVAAKSVVDEIPRALVLIRTNGPVTCNASGHTDYACYADLSVDSLTFRAISVYVPTFLPNQPSRLLGNWLSKTAKRSPYDFILGGDFNTNTSPIPATIVHTKRFKELVRMRTTRQLGGLLTSIDRIYVPRNSIFRLKAPFSWGAFSDHCALRIVCDHQIILNPLPSVARPHSLRQIKKTEMNTLKDMTTAFLANTRDPNARRHPSTNLSRLKKALTKRLELRLLAINDDDQVQITQLNRTIRQIRKKVLHLVLGDDADPVGPVRYPYQPPAALNSREVEHFYKDRFHAIPFALLPLPPPLPPITTTFLPEQIQDAAKLLRKNARTTDFSATFLNDLSGAHARTVARSFDEWMTTGIPVEIATSWVFPVRKPGSRGPPKPKHFRPVMILSLFSKLLDTVVANMVKQPIYDYVRKHNFQMASVSKHGMIGIIQSTLDWLQQNPRGRHHGHHLDDPYVAVLTDVQSAYDSVDHARLLHMIKQILGQQWVPVFQTLLDAQLYTISLREGFTGVWRMGRGLRQGSTLSVLLYLLYTAVPPQSIPRGLFCQAIVDDITVLCRLSEATAVLEGLYEWATEGLFGLAASKTLIISPTVGHLAVTWGNATMNAPIVQRARLLGACVHANSDTKSCPTNIVKTEAVWRISAQICTGVKYMASRKKINIFKSRGQSLLSIHALSPCFDPSRDKLRAPSRMLIPTHKSKGLMNYASSSMGYNVMPMETFQGVAKTRALLATKPQYEGPLPIQNYVRLSTPPPENTPIPPVVHKVVDLLKANAHCNPLRVATDGGFQESTCSGTIGIAVEGSYVGAKITSTVFSSTNSETAAALVFALAFRIVNSPARVIDPDDVLWFCDARNVQLQQASESLTDPGAVALHSPDIPSITWAKGHAKNEWINRADSGATQARDYVQQVVDILHLLTHLGIPRVMRYVFAATCDAIQLADYPKFLKSATNYIKERPMRLTLAARCDPTCWDRRTMSKLAKIPGALDLLQAIMRGAILPWANKTVCSVPGCRQTLTLQHALMVNDRNHRDFFGIAGDLNKIPTPRTVKTIMKQFAQQHFTTMIFLATRTKKLLADDPNVKDWCRWLITAVT